MILTIYYDGHCPLCMIEMKSLKKHDSKNAINLIDLHSDNFSEDHPHINKTDAIGILHGQLNNGELLLGLDVSCKAWLIVGKHKWMAILRWPIIKSIADMFYRLFARHRSKISFILTGKKPCNSCNLY